ncbi:MAG: hypothetical protein IKW89_10720 [Bacteroidales bacterium]|nr:hypothetical protein [Bacteroidales bacterium]
MKYIVRAVKFFIWFCVVFCLMLAIMAVMDIVDPDPDLMFRDGVKSMWQIAILFVAVSLIYPLSGFMKKEAIIPGEYNEIRDRIIECMSSRGYILETEDGENMTFRLRSKAARAFKMFEDRITLTREPGGFVVEGLRKIVVRIVRALEYAIRENGQDDYSK